MLDLILFTLLTAGTHSVFLIKLTLNGLLRGLLGFIIAANVIVDTTALGKTYITMALLIIVCLFCDGTIRGNSLYFDFIDTLFRPIVLIPNDGKVIRYSRRWHLILMISLLIIEILKILAGIVCIIDLDISVDKGAYLSYWLLGLLLLESMIAVIVYSIAIVMIALRRNFFLKWMRWMAQWYLEGVVNYNITKRENIITMTMNKLNVDARSSIATPDVLHELSKVVLGSTSGDQSTSD